MPNIIPLAFLDPFEIAGSLPRRMGLFRDGVIVVRGPRAGADDPDDDVAYRQLLDVGKWPELKSMLAKIKRVGEGAGGIEFGRICLQLLPPGHPVEWQPPLSGYFERFNRLLMALRTNPQTVHFSGTEQAHLAHGIVTWINQRTWTSAINLGESMSVHLIVDTRRREDKG